MNFVSLDLTFDDQVTLVTTTTDSKSSAQQSVEIWRIGSQFRLRSCQSSKVQNYKVLHPSPVCSFKMGPSVSSHSKHISGFNNDTNPFFSSFTQV
ncbi:hypothetical protein TNCV_1119771 [Trichonephila clavipes]|uniref:Uncharacterized protein n=1 Tax=Trichonephila clavipes TaxID=2585209 RepID=A0A8X6SZZ8_TRICX|nr:hypothetical protein TNCV_1119771 [Trichonephila clavipes]